MNLVEPNIVHSSSLLSMPKDNDSSYECLSHIFTRIFPVSLEV